MQMASSAKRAWRLCRSASEYTATVRIPRSLQAEITRMAISPRLAMRIFRNIGGGNAGASTRPDRKQPLSVFDRPPVFHQLRNDGARNFRLDFVHQLHGFDDAQ